MKPIKDYYDRSKATLHKIGHVVEAVTLICVICTGGFVVGQWYATENYKEALTQQRLDHIAELERLQKTQTEALGFLSRRTEFVANTVVNAAAAAATAASASSKAVQEIKKSNTQSSKIAVPTREAINNSVERANRLNKQ
jgi:hypothetical protein